jgi:DNA-binding XRE family transcriptional regulator
MALASSDHARFDIARRPNTARGTMQMQRWRERHSMNRAQMAALVGVSRATITKWESGLTFPSPENIRKVKRITNSEVTETDWHRLHDRTRKPLAADDE